MEEKLQWIISQIKANPMISASLSFWLLSLLSNTIKSIPVSIFNFIKAQLITTVVISNYDKSYYEFLTWYEKEKYRKYSRSLKVSNGQHGDSDKPIVSAGNGFHFFLKSGRLFFFKITKADANHTTKEKESLTLSYIGRNHAVATSLLSEILEGYKEPDKTGIYVYSYGWSKLTAETKRNFDTVFIDKEVSDKLFSHIDRFLTSKALYEARGIPYRTGILLHGPPGTGKTSLIKALAGKYSRDLSLINIDELEEKELSDALCRASSKSIVIMEDIDSLSSAKSRNRSMTEDNSENTVLLPVKTKISSLLNALDGIGSFTDKVLIMTTNHIEKLDSALLRPGRIDLILEITELSDTTIKSILKNKFNYESPSNTKYKPVKGCDLQKIFTSNDYDIEKIIPHLETLSE